MKKIILIILIFTNIFPKVFGQWSEQVIIPTPPKLNCVATLSYNESWIGGDSGIILYTSNSGVNWVYRNNPVIGTNNVYIMTAVYGNFFPPGKALCSASSTALTYIYRTTNQGINWTVVYQQSGGRIRGMTMLDTSNGYAIGDPVGGRWTILKTSNGGLSFDSSGLFLPQNGNEISNYNSFYMAIYPDVFLFGTNSGRLYSSTNYGARLEFNNYWSSKYICCNTGAMPQTDSYRGTQQVMQLAVGQSILQIMDKRGQQ